MTKSLFWFFFMLFGYTFCAAQSSLPALKPTDQGSSVSFKIKNFGFMTGGSFTGIQGTLFFDPNDLAHSSFDVSVDASTINTDNSMRDGHLKKDDYFDVEHYPRIRFVSTQIRPGKGGSYMVTGNLTIKKTTMAISFPFVATALGNDYIFKGDFTLNRKDFDVGGNSTISNSLTVSLTVLAKR